MKNNTPSKIIISLRHIDHAHKLKNALLSFFGKSEMGGDAEMFIKHSGKLSSCGLIGHDVRSPNIEHIIDENDRITALEQKCKELETENETKQKMLDKQFGEIEDIKQSLEQSPPHTNMNHLITAIKKNLQEISYEGHNTGYDWNADEKSLTLRESKNYELLNQIEAENENLKQQLAERVPFPILKEVCQSFVEPAYIDGALRCRHDYRTICTKQNCPLVEKS